VFFLGGAEGVAERLAEALRRSCAGLHVVGAVGPPFREPTPDEDQALVERLNASGAELVFVALGCPKQERWMASHRARLTAPALLGVGAAFDFHTGRVPQAPRWMMRAGLEWLYRLLQEPRRLWRRYLILNPLFLVHVMLQLLGLRRYGSDASDAADGAPPLR
jgi:N-acetylglucosaminyldiphosphoundecaprenol N-acetyl-beta-D-mannosaminyltransferase